jgi:hypothetical protein
MMGFSEKQQRLLRRRVPDRHIRKRRSDSRELSYIEGAYAIAEANRIFGFDGWDRETIEARCVFSRELKGTFHTAYVAKVRITVRTESRTIVREGYGSGEGRGASPAETHELALKSAETDGTKRALVTFGKPFGLALYASGTVPTERSTRRESNLATLSGCKRPAEGAGQPGHASQVPPPFHSSPEIHASRVSAPTYRRRDKQHLKFVASQPCTICSRLPSDPHHLRFAQPRALGAKVSDEFTVPLCRGHHRELHQAGNEAEWWANMSIDPLPIARKLWLHWHLKADERSDSAVAL